jgi:site-specific recombinase XerD
VKDEEYSQYVKRTTVKGIKMPRIGQVMKAVFTDVEIDALFEASQHPDKPHEYQLRDKAILALLIDTGIRSAEIRTLTMGNVTLARDAAEDSYKLF